MCRPIAWEQNQIDSSCFVLYGLLAVTIFQHFRRRGVSCGFGHPRCSLNKEIERGWLPEASQSFRPSSGDRATSCNPIILVKIVVVTRPRRQQRRNRGVGDPKVKLTYRMVTERKTDTGGHE